MSVRLQKFLAEAGVGSRRACEKLISEGRVTIGGRTATLGESVEADQEAVAVDGRAVCAEEKEYWLLNKPRGVLSAAHDSRGRRTVVDLVPTGTRVYPVGRLDLDTTGLLVLTNDGELAERLLHPRYHVAKEYLATVRGRVGDAALEELRRGVTLEEGITSPAAVTRENESGGKKPQTTLRLVIHEGRKRQVRRMLESVGHRVVALNRSKFAGLIDTGLAPGEARTLSEVEVSGLRRLAGLQRK